jgi:predicted dehydrogenase
MIRMAQYGVGHGHAAGKMNAMRENPGVEVIGIFEPDTEKRERAAKERAYEGLRWFRSAEEMLADGSIQAVAIEGRNDESLLQGIEVAQAGKHLWYDKPAGDDWVDYLRFIELIRGKNLQLQMGYMLRYSAAFKQVAEWTHSGFLGHVFSVRAHMSNWIPVHAASNSGFTREHVGAHRGGMFYDLGGHMLDQVVYLLGRPVAVTSFLRNDTTPELPAMADNTLGVFEFEKAMATVDIAAMEPTPPARRFEVYGTEGTAIIPEPFEPGAQVRLVLREAKGGYQKGLQMVDMQAQPRDELYKRELVAFLAVLNGEKAPDRTLEHEILVQETLLRATGGIPGR